MGFSVHAVRGDHLGRRGALLDPLFERRQVIELIRSRPAGAVAHSRREEEAVELTRLCDPAHRFHDGIVIRDRVLPWGALLRADEVALPRARRSSDTREIAISA